MTEPLVSDTRGMTESLVEQKNDRVTGEWKGEGEGLL